jgi:hypothetical protein
MQTTIRTTLRIRKDLLDQSRRLALERGTHLQDVINDILARGFDEVTDLNRHQHAIAAIDSIRKELITEGAIDTQLIVDENKKELDKRRNR